MEHQIKWMKHREDWEIHRDKFQEIFGEEIEEGDQEVYDDGYNEEEEMQLPTGIMQGPMIFPMMIQGGMIQSPKSKLEKYKFMPWILLTNFDVDEKLLFQMKQFQGIEVCDRVSRYQFFIGIGALFCKHSVDDDEHDIDTWDSSEVRRQFGKFLIGKESLESLEELKEKLSEKKHWAIIKFPNGSTEHVSADEWTEKFQQDLKDYLELSDRTKAECFTNHDM